MFILGFLPGGTKYLLLGLAICLAVLAYRVPREANTAGIFFIFAAAVVLPSSARFSWSWKYEEPWQLYYHATGLLLVTVAATARVGAAALLRVPLSVKCFLLVAAGATIFGFVNGNDPSYVIRQFYGSLLLVVYFALAVSVGEEALFLKRMRSFALLCAVGFFVYYAVVFSEYGLHREIGTSGTLAAASAILCFISGIVKRQLSWVGSGLVLLCVPLLLFERRALLTFLVAVFLGMAMGSSTKKWKLLFYSLAVLATLPGIFTASGELVLEKALDKVPWLEDFLPAGTYDVESLVDRNLQLIASVDVISRSPVLGDGMGANIQWRSPVLGPMDQAYVDNGWAYLLTKTGLLGACAFLWFLATVLPCISRRSLAVSVCLLGLLLVMLFTEPVFFQFSTSPLLGSLAGLLYRRKLQERASPSQQEQMLSPPALG